MDLWFIFLHKFFAISSSSLILFNADLKLVYLHLGSLSFLKKPFMIHLVSVWYSPFTIFFVLEHGNKIFAFGGQNQFVSGEIMATDVKTLRWRLCDFSGLLVRARTIELYTPFYLFILVILQRIPNSFV